MGSYKRLPGQSDEELIFRVCKDKDLIGSWSDVADVLNQLTGKRYGESKYRKEYTSFTKLFEANRAALGDTEEQINELNEKIRELQAEKIQFRDERNAWNKQNYLRARVDQKLDYLADRLLENSRFEFPDVSEYSRPGGSDLLVILSDFHIGATFDNNFGYYDTDVAKERLAKLYQEIINIADRHECQDCYISLQGDIISGNIHRAIQVTNRENVIDQVKIASDLITNFCYLLCQRFRCVNFHSVSGNHTRIDRKDDAIHNERLDDLIAWTVSLRLNNVSNFAYRKNYYDTGISQIFIRGNEYVGVHGDYDDYSPAGVSKLCMMLGHVPYAVLYGHLHTCAVSESNNVKMIRGGSLCGSGDNYTVEKRLSGKPTQMVCVCNEDGVEAYYPVEL